MISIRVQNLTKRFGAVTALHQLDLVVGPGELFFLLGPSGCGKTTLLRCMAGFYIPDEGKIFFGDEDVTQLAPHKRNTGMMFQSYALWPHMTVAENVAFGLEERKLPKTEIRTKVGEALESVHMGAYADRRPNQLSGGQQQRVALARALVIRPRCLLLDEPLSNLDAKLRLEMRMEIRRVCKEFKLTTVYVTHDQKEALSVSDRMAVLDSGHILQVGTPQEIYRRPARRTVAEFIGETNFIAGTLTSASQGRARVSTPIGDLDGVFGGEGSTPPVGSAVTVSVRPECWTMTHGRPQENAVAGRIGKCVYLGENAQYDFVSGATTLKILELNPRFVDRPATEEFFAGVKPDDVVVLGDWGLPMLKRGIMVLALVATVALPFILRPHRESPGEADDTLVLVSPHNEAIRHEFTLGFSDWYKARTGRTVFLDWRNVGGTSDITRFLEGEYVASFRSLWTGKLGRPWSMEVQSGFQDGRLEAAAPAAAREARSAFLASDAGCGIDLFFGGGSSDFESQAQAGRLVDSGVRRLHPDWFTDAAFPLKFGGETYRDPDDLWYGSVLSSYGIIFNKDSLARLGFEHGPEQWSDLADPRYVGEVGLCDPMQSGSIAQAFLNVIQQQIHHRVDASGIGGSKSSDAAVRAGWVDAMRLLQLLGANARYFTDSSQKPPIDVANGDCAAGMCIDFYGREQQEAVRRRNGGVDRIGYTAPEGGASYSVDPIALLRGAPHRSVAVAFIEYTLSLEGQRIWNYRTGSPGGPKQFALRRLPVRRDFYGGSDWEKYSSDPGVDPYKQKKVLIPNSAWTGPLWNEMRFIIRVMTEDTHPELASAWRAIIAAPEPAKSRALAVLQDVSVVDYDQALGRIKKGVRSRNQVDAVVLARDIGGVFRENYRRAEGIARGSSEP